MNYTKGPWELVDSYPRCNRRGDFYPSFKEIKGPSIKVGLVMYATSDYSSRMGDLRLMSAAPELYEALKSMLTFYGMDEEPGEVSGVVHKQARAAIAKARGE